MYWRLPFPAAPPVDDAGDLDAALRVARDADGPERARVAAVHRLRGAPADARAAVARQLAPILNEPLRWLGSELHACLIALDPTLALGVDARGALAASPEPEDALQRDDDGVRHCPALGVVVAVAHAGGLRRRLAAPPPWLCAPPHGGALFAVRRGGAFVRRTYLGGDGGLGAIGEIGEIGEIGDARAEVRFRDGHVVIAARAEALAGSAPTINGVPVDGAAGVRLGDVVGLPPFALVLEEIVPPAAPSVAIPLARPRNGRAALHVGEAIQWEAGHVVNLGPGADDVARRVGVVSFEGGVGARELFVAPGALLALDGAPRVVPASGP